MASQSSLDNLFIDLAERISQMSHGVRAKVGSVIVKEDNILSMGWNGTPPGDDNVCEIQNSDGSLVTKPEVLHAEWNAIAKIARDGGTGAKGGTVYVTMSPCVDCAKLIHRAGISRLVYRDQYRDVSGLEFLSNRKVQIVQLTKE